MYSRHLLSILNLQGVFLYYYRISQLQQVSVAVLIQELTDYEIQISLKR